jgi:hypothetical protein
MKGRIRKRDGWQNIKKKEIKKKRWRARSIHAQMDVLFQVSHVSNVTWGVQALAFSNVPDQVFSPVLLALSPLRDLASSCGTCCILSILSAPDLFSVLPSIFGMMNCAVVGGGLPNLY